MSDGLPSWVMLDIAPSESCPQLPLAWWELCSQPQDDMPLQQGPDLWLDEAPDGPNGVLPDRPPLPWPGCLRSAEIGN